MPDSVAEYFGAHVASDSENKTTEVKVVTLDDRVDSMEMKFRGDFLKPTHLSGSSNEREGKARP